jgi:hypothetical protein
LPTSSDTIADKELRGTKEYGSWQAMLRIRDILVQIFRLMDPDTAPDPAIFVTDLQDANKKLFFSAYYFFKVHLHHFSETKSHKEVTKQ